jgi:hypothetical protein
MAGEEGSGWEDGTVESGCVEGCVADGAGVWVRGGRLRCASRSRAQYTQGL